MPYLKFNLNNGTDYSFELEQTAATLGRALDCEILIENAFISKKHSMFKMVAPGVYEIIDLGGKNGTYVNGGRVQRHTLRDGDELYFGGQVRAVYQQQSAAVAAHKTESKGEKVKPVVRKLGADAFEGAGETSPLDPNEFTSTQTVAARHPDKDVEKVDPVDLLESLIRRARKGEKGEDLLSDLEHLRDLIGSSNPKSNS